MAFPTTPVLDNFDRANQGPPPSANWSNDVVAGVNGLKVVSNQLVQTVGDGTAASAWWSIQQFPADVEAYFSIAATDATQNARIYIRLQNPGTGTRSGYLLFIGTAAQTIYRMDNGAFTALGASESQSFSAGDSAGFGAVGNVLSFYKKTAGVWSLVTTRNDPTYTLPGYIGVGFDSTIWAGDNFGGGKVVTASDPVLTAMSVSSQLKT